ncbi:MAG: hypothetical protein IIA87_01395 [Nanoarchaeota archaeon]|nr:hypothetical protein [Nanoarchaeota archaeon]
MNKTHIIITIIIAVSLFSVVLVTSQSDGNPFSELLSVLEEIRDITNDILFEAEEISDKNATVNVNVTNENNMAKRGFITIKTRTNFGGNTPSFITHHLPIYVTLPNGQCNVVISSDCNPPPSNPKDVCFITKAKDLNTFGEVFNFTQDFEGDFEIDDEFYMVRIVPNGTAQYSRMYLSYNCQ